MRYALKEARLQSPVLTNRNGIRGCLRGVSKHIFVMPVTNNPQMVDAAGIG